MYKLKIFRKIEENWISDFKKMNGRLPERLEILSFREGYRIGYDNAVELFLWKIKEDQENE